MLKNRFLQDPTFIEITETQISRHPMLRKDQPSDELINDLRYSVFYSFATLFFFLLCGCTADHCFDVDAWETKHHPKKKRIEKILLSILYCVSHISFKYLANVMNLKCYELQIVCMRVCVIRLKHTWFICLLVYRWSSMKRLRRFKNSSFDTCVFNAPCAHANTHASICSDTYINTVLASK